LARYQDEIGGEHLGGFVKQKPMDRGKIQTGKHPFPPDATERPDHETAGENIKQQRGREANRMRRRRLAGLIA
jgi:hypothetical protein